MEAANINRNPYNYSNHNLSYLKRQKLNEADKALFESLCDIIKSGDSKQLRDKLSEGLMFDINTMYENSCTLLMKAAEVGQFDCVKVLLEFGALVDLPHTDVGHEDWYNRSSAVYLATKNGHFNIVKLLLEADPHASVNHPQYRPLYEACRKGHLETAKLLVEHGAELQNIMLEYDTNALMNASCSGNAELVEYLIGEGADINYENKYNSHALLVACEGRHIGVMEVLLENSADVNVMRMGPDSKEDTCLNIACQRGDLEMIRLLLKYKADMTVYNQEGLSPFTTAYSRGFNEAVDLFLEHGVDLNNNASRLYYQQNGGWLPIRDKWTPLMHACYRRDVEMAKRLLAHGADVNVISASEPDLPYVSTNVSMSIGNEELLQLLLDNGADVNLTDDLGNTALLTVLRARLEDYDSDYDDIVPEEAEPLSPAVLKGVRMLLDYGFDIMHENDKGKTAFDYVATGSEVEVLLREYRDRKPVLK